MVEAGGVAKDKRRTFFAGDGKGIASPQREDRWEGKSVGGCEVMRGYLRGMAGRAQEISLEITSIAALQYGSFFGT
jgi:hypothetical protein